MFNSKIAHRFFIIAPVEKSPGSPHVCGIFHPPLQYTKPAAFFNRHQAGQNAAASRRYPRVFCDFRCAPLTKYASRDITCKQ